MLADAPGRMRRTLPPFLAEQIEFMTEARAQTLVPWITDGGAPAQSFADARSTSRNLHAV
jgi:hypothetical protein